MTGRYEIILVSLPLSKKWHYIIVYHRDVILSKQKKEGIDSTFSKNFSSLHYYRKITRVEDKTNDGNISRNGTISRI